MNTQQIDSVGLSELEWLQASLEPYAEREREAIVHEADAPEDAPEASLEPWAGDGADD
jgi:hypothetical protein